MIIQIYAFTDPDQAVSAASLGVDHIGFVAGRYDLVPGELTFKEAKQLCTALPPGAKASALTMATDVDEILKMVDAVEPDILHISTDVEDVPEPAMAALKKHLSPSIQIMKALPVGGGESLALAKRFEPFSDIFLLDTKVKNMPGVGATGRVHNWSISRQIVQECDIPVILAGGLHADNVNKAIAAVSPWGVDSNTHTNIPGDNVKKDMDRIAAFIAAVRDGVGGMSNAA
jgi:phosphoribosylanthranilate isomerase